MKVITVTNSKGGVFNTATVVSLGHWFARQGLPTIIEDLDWQADASKSLDVEPAKSASLYLDGGEPCLAKTKRPCLSVLAGNGTLEKFEKVLSSRLDMDEDALERTAKRMRGIAVAERNIILIDTAKKGLIRQAAVMAADVIVIPSQVDYNSACDTISTVSAVKTWNPNARVVVLPVGLDNRQTRFNDEAINMIAQSVQCDIYQSGIPHSAAVKRCGWNGKTVWEGGQYANVADAYAGFGQWLIGEME